MKLVIDIPEEAYECIKATSSLGWLTSSEYADAIKHGTPLDTVVGQIKWERDVAIQQLQDLGYGLGEMR